MRTLKFGLAAAIAAFAAQANAQSAVTGMGNPPGGVYQTEVVAGSQAVDTFAFHAGGVAACDGCHVMHNASPDARAKSTAAGSAYTPWSNYTNAYLLQGSDQSSTCLICHSSSTNVISQQFVVADLSGSANIPANRTPAGDFGWLTKTWASDGRQGHNVVASDFDMLPADAQMRRAPGGDFVSGSGRAAFACSSCHDPHGRYRMEKTATGYEFTGWAAKPSTLPTAASGSYGQEPVAGEYAVGTYRLLAGQFYAPSSNSSVTFVSDPPVAVAPKTYNRDESSGAGGEVHVAYGSGMSEWCQNCHMNVHMDNYTTGVEGLRHPAGNGALFHATQIQIYNSYLSSGKINAGQADAYTSLVPFEWGTSQTLTTLKDKTTAASLRADTASNVMCLSCHRAHASAFDSMVRWDQNATFLADGTKLVSSEGRTNLELTAGYYGRAVGAVTASGDGTIGPYQRSLCNKCHSKD